MVSIPSMHRNAPAIGSNPRPTPPSAPLPRPTRGPRTGHLIAAGALLAVSLLVRLAPSPKFFTPDGVLLATDGDTYYHALRSERIARAWPHVPWFDPGMNHPYGAEVIWPPLFDQLIATSAVATGPATADHVAAVAAIVPVILGLGVVALAALMAARLTALAGWEAALLVALLPAAARFGCIGRADHHVLESLLAGLAVLALTQGIRHRSSWPRASLLATVLALAFWNWPGSAMYLLVLGACVAALHVLQPPGDPTAENAALQLARGAAMAGVLLGLSIGLLGPPGALWSMRLTPISGLSVVLTLLTSAAAAVIVLARRYDRGAGIVRRAAHLAAACALPLAVVLAVPPALREGVAHGATAVSAGNAWYQFISEFQPLVFSGWHPWTEEVAGATFAYGLTPILLIGAGVLLVRAWRESPDRRPYLIVLAVWTVSTLGLVVFRRRFECYAVLPLAVCAGWVVHEGAATLSAKLRRGRGMAAALAIVGVLLAAAPGLPAAFTGGIAELPDGAPDKYPLFRWLASVPATPGREGVLAFWAHGHDLQWLARRPVVSTPFGSDIDARSLGGEASFITALEPSAARALLDERRIGFVLVQNPVSEVATIGRLAPGSAELASAERSLVTGVEWALREELLRRRLARRRAFAVGLPPRRGEPDGDRGPRSSHQRVQALPGRGRGASPGPCTVPGDAGPRDGPSHHQPAARVHVVRRRGVGRERRRDDPRPLLGGAERADGRGAVRGVERRANGGGARSGAGRAGRERGAGRSHAHWGRRTRVARDTGRNSAEADAACGRT